MMFGGAMSLYGTSGSVRPSSAPTRPPSRASAEDTAQVVAFVRDPPPTRAYQPGVEVGSTGLTSSGRISVLFLSVLLVRLFCFFRV